MAEWLLEPLQYGFFLRGLSSGLMTALVCGVLSGFIVWRGMAFIGDALAHAILPGIVLAVMFGFPLLLGALAAAFVSVIGIGALTSHRGLKEDSAIGVIFAGAFALGILLMGMVATFKDLNHVLFGNILGVSRADLWIIAVIGGLVLLSVLLFYKELLVSSFDPTHATAIGLSPRQIHYGLLILIAATTVIATQTVGVVLVMALLVTPAATASLLVKNFTRVLVLSVMTAVVSVIVGFYLSFYLNTASGASIVIVLTLLFLCAFIYSRIKHAVVVMEKETRRD
jgi:ABC-type Mn2+/Zn2+ transport system permease subunit